MKVIVIDTPGLGDTDNRDTAHLAKMVISFKTIGWTNTFLIVLNSGDNKIDEKT